jgi:RND family efflux transporter MFP subunit
MRAPASVHRAWSLAAVLACALGPASGEELPELRCLIEPTAVIEVSASVDGVIQSVEVERGDLVEKGQVLAELESSVERATVKLARTRSRMDAELKARKASLEYTRRKQERIGELYRKKTVSFQEKDEADTEAALAELELGRARQEMQLAKVELERAQANLELRIVRSPIRAVVVERMLLAGESASDRPIVKLAQIDPLKVEVIVPVALLGRIQPGMRAEVMPEAPVEGIYEARVVIVDRLLDAASGTYGVRLELPNPDYGLYGGLHCMVRFLPAEASDSSQGAADEGR